MRISDWSSDVCSSDLPVQPVGLLLKGADRVRRCLGSDELMLKALEHPRLDPLAPDGVAVGACAATIVVGAAVAVFDQDRVAPTAGPASEQPRQQVTLSVHAAQADRVMCGHALDAGPVSIGKSRSLLFGPRTEKR